MKSDVQIKKDVEDELDWDPAVSANGIEVTVTDGVVTLTGTLHYFAETLAAKSAAQRVGGVKAVSMDLKVRRSTDSAQDDTDIAAAANHALHWNAAVPKSKVHIVVEDGWVSLRGEVDWEYQRHWAVRALHGIVGVTGISNGISITPRASPADIQKGIEGALGRHADRKTHDLQVFVDGSRVTLKGTAHSWGEWQAAQVAAWSAPGVSGVNNEITLA